MKLLKKVLVCSFFCCAIGMSSHAHSGSNITYASLPLQTHAEQPLKNIPIKLKVDMTIHYTWNGLNCSAHVTGYVVMEFNPTTNTFLGILEQQLSTAINCKGKLSDLFLREVRYDGRQFTAVSFEQSDDEDMDSLLQSTEFTKAFLAELNASLSLSR